MSRLNRARQRLQQIVLDRNSPVSALRQQLA